MNHPAETTVIIEPRNGLLHLNLKELWDYRELLYFLVWRDLKVRYKQTAIGIGWAVVQPLLTMVIFTIIFGVLIEVPSDGLPYSVFTYSALLPWNYFASALHRCVASVVGDAALVSKVYFPRIILPLAGTVSGLVDFLVSLILLLGMMAWFQIPASIAMLAVPLFLLLALCTAFAVGLWLSALNVRYRDVGHTIPFLVQVWMYASPIVYPASMIPASYRFVYGLNPMAGVIEGFRWALLGKQSPDFVIMGISISVVLALMLGGLVFFRNWERNFADVV